MSRTEALSLSHDFWPNDIMHLADAHRRRQAPFLNQVAQGLFARCGENTVTFVVRQVAPHPRDVRRDAMQGGAGPAHGLVTLEGAELAESNDFLFDDELRHRPAPHPCLLNLLRPYHNSRRLSPGCTGVQSIRSFSRAVTHSPFWRAHRQKRIATARQSNIENTEQSVPRAPPVSQSGPDKDMSTRPCRVGPLLENPKMPPWVKFQAKWMPIGNQRLRLAT